MYCCVTSFCCCFFFFFFSLLCNLFPLLVAFIYNGIGMRDFCMHLFISTFRYVSFFFLQFLLLLKRTKKIRCENKIQIFLISQQRSAKKTNNSYEASKKKKNETTTKTLENCFVEVALACGQQAHKIHTHTPKLIIYHGILFQHSIFYHFSFAFVTKFIYCFSGTEYISFVLFSFSHLFIRLYFMYFSHFIK